VGVGKTSLYEQIVFQRWLTVLHLLKQGIPYNVIEELSPQEMGVLLGITAAVAQKEAQRKLM